MFAISLASTQTPVNYHPLDPKDPIQFLGNRIIYGGDAIALGPHDFFIDGQLSDQEAEKYPFVFNSIQSAVQQLSEGTEAHPMTLYIAPWVYWIDNPDDPEIRVPEPGDRAPYGMKIRCKWLRFYGLNKDPNNVVLACNRGQTIGAQGNFTMFRFYGDGTSSENITFGNYCNVDLEFPLKPELSKKKRAEAIVQAQLIHCDGDKIVARNTRFISRLNLCPFVGGKRVLFDRCHFESTDDALCGTGVYLNSTFDFYSSKPFYITRGTGTVLLNCDIHTYCHGNQYFVKAGGQLAVVDSRFHAEDKNLYVGWKDLPPVSMRNYQFDNTLNKRLLFIGANDAANTVDMMEKPILDAYRIRLDNGVLYNTYNLLKANDDWDPMGIKSYVQEAELMQHTRYTDIPTQLLMRSDRDTIETGKDKAELSVELFRFGNVPVTPDSILFTIWPEGDPCTRLIRTNGGITCTVIPDNQSQEAQKVIIVASTPSGLEAAVELLVLPSIQPAPGFRKTPEITLNGKGTLSVKYQLDTDLDDQSLITWYRCIDKMGTEDVPMAISRFNKPLYVYELNAGDAGYYIKAMVEPKHNLSNPGNPVEVLFPNKIQTGDIQADSKVLHPYFSKLSTVNQPKVLPGFWTFRHLDNLDGPVPTGDAWYYGEGRDGAQDISGLMQGRSGFMCYTPVANTNKGMELSLQIAPYKSSGQGFSVAPLYMDLLIKFDSETMSGYGLRIERTTKYGNSVDFVFVQYKNGEVTRIGEPVSTSCYRTNCHIQFQMKAGKLIATAGTDAKYNASSYPEAVVAEVVMELPVEVNSFGSVGILYNGGAPAVIRDLAVEWKRKK